MQKKYGDKNFIDSSLKNRLLIIASNRGPVQHVTNNKKILQKRGSGGLITALHSVLMATKAIWIAAALTDEDREIAKEKNLVGVPDDDPSYWVKYVDIESNIFNDYYYEVSNRVLWFLQHYLFDTVSSPEFDSSFNKAWEEGYMEVNRRFAKVILDACGDVEDPIVFIHDYHLYGVASYLRRLKPDAIIFHFIHIPWCCPDYLRILPAYVRKSILNSLLCCDIVGLHNWRYVGNLITCYQEFLGLKIDLKRHLVSDGNRTLRIKAYPISVDVDSLKDFSRSAEVISEENKFLSLKGDHKAIVRIDRAELSKNLIRGFTAFSSFLKKNPGWLKKVKFFAYAYPTRGDIEAYGSYSDLIREKVKMINEKFGTHDWQPIELEMSDNFPRSVAALKHYDVLMTNPVFDGMNLVAKEAVVLNENDGVIILSENAGAYDELKRGVLGVNPFDVGQTADMIEHALSMGAKERSEKATLLKSIVAQNDIYKWLKHQFQDINKITVNQPSTKKTGAPH